MELNTVYGWIALITLGVIVVQLILSIFFGGILDLDVDGDGDADIDAGTILSPKGLLHFLCGGSWYLVLKNPHTGWDYLIAIGVGISAAFLMFMVYYLMYKLACEKPQESGEELVGRSCTVYLALENNQYEVMVEINGAQRNLIVKSSGKEEVPYKSGDILNIKSYKDGIYYV